MLRGAIPPLFRGKASNAASNPWGSCLPDAPAGFGAVAPGSCAALPARLAPQRAAAPPRGGRGQPRPIATTSPPRPRGSWAGQGSAAAAKSSVASRFQQTIELLGNKNGREVLSPFGRCIWAGDRICREGAGKHWSQNPFISQQNSVKGEKWNAWQVLWV